MQAAAALHADDRFPIARSASPTAYAVELSELFKLFVDWLNYLGVNPLTNGSGAGLDIKLVAGAGSATSNGVAYLQSSDASTTFQTGSAYTFSGNQAGSGDSGDAGVGSGNTAAGTSGPVAVYTGNSSAGASGLIGVSTGTSGAGNTGNVGLATGNATGGNSGDIALTIGTATGTRGSIIVDAPLVTGTTATPGLTLITANDALGASGVVYIASNAGTGSGDRNTGSVTMESGGPPTGAGDTGYAALGTSSATTGQPGDVFLYTGSSTGAGKRGGDIVLTAGTGGAGGRSGVLNLDASILPTSSAGLPSGAVWRDAGAGNVLKAVP